MLDSAPFLSFCKFSRVTEINNLREFDERPWGRYTVLEERSGFKVKVLEVEPGARLSLQRHARRAEHWVVVQGVADIVCGDQTRHSGLSRASQSWNWLICRTKTNPISDPTTAPTTPMAAP